MSVDLSNTSIAQWFAERERHRCGYCKNPSGSISYGMMTEELMVEDYKDLIDRGWRRSGKYCYKPTLDETCCPQYTIRCDALEFTLNKSHKKIIKKFNKFLNDGEFNKNVPPDQQEEETSSEIPGYNRKSTINLTKSVTTDDSSASQLQLEQEKSHTDQDGEVDLFAEENKERNLQNETDDFVRPSTETCQKNKKPPKDGTGPDPNKPPCKKAKLLRLERKKDKLRQNGVEIQTNNKNNNSPKTVNQFLEEIPLTSKHKFKLKIIPTSISGDEWEQAECIEFELYKKYQMIVHNDPPEKLNKRSFTRFLASSPLKVPNAHLKTIYLERMTRNHRTFDVSAKLFKKYQLSVHNELPSSSDANEFNDFLVRTPLKPKPFPNGIEGPGYGSFHQQYWLDDKLIAVGVIDILPGCVSSVYFFYDPDYRDLTLGTYGSLREIQLVQSLYLKIPDLKYYYMGFYIHSCPKMRYKGKLHPSYLLCPETYVWVPIENCLGKLDVNKYSRFNSDVVAIDTNSCSSNDVNNIKVVYNYKLMYVTDYVRVFDGDIEVFENVANLIGRKSAHSIIFWIA